METITIQLNDIGKVRVSPENILWNGKNCRALLIDADLEIMILENLIINTVCWFFKIDLETFKKKDRHPQYVWPRQYAAYLLYKFVIDVKKIPKQQHIAELVGSINHATIHNSISRVRWAIRFKDPIRYGTIIKLIQQTRVVLERNGIHFIERDIENDNPRKK